MFKRFLVIAGLLLAPAASHAALITFGPGPYGSPVANTVEGIFTYGTFSGGLFRDAQGNGDAYNMEGCSVCGGGVLSVVRNDVVGGLFTFGGADVAFQFNQVYGITFEGYLNGNLVASDIFNTLGNSAYSTHVASNLSNMNIDELRVVLNATGTTATVVDNIVLNSPANVPEPSSMVLLSSALLGLVVLRKSKFRR